MDRTSWTYSISQKGLQLKQYVYIILKQIIQYYYSTGNLICYVIFFFINSHLRASIFDPSSIFHEFMKKKKS